MFPHRSRARTLLAVLGVVSVVHLVAEWLDAAGWSTPTQWLLMPVLVAVVLSGTTRPRSRLVVGTVCALGFSWLGDSAPSLGSGKQSFLVMVGFFLIAQITYIVVFRPFLDRTVLRNRRGLAVVYAVAVLVLAVVCAPGAGGLFVPVLVYGLCLATMAFCASAVHPWTGVGGALFLVSDGLIAVNRFVPEFSLSHNGFWVMSSYIAAQVLIVLGVLARERSAAATGALDPA